MPGPVPLGGPLLLPPLGYAATAPRHHLPELMHGGLAARALANIIEEEGVIIEEEGEEEGVTIEEEGVIIIIIIIIIITHTHRGLVARALTTRVLFGL